MRFFVKYILPFLIIALIISALLMHKGVINSELPLEFNKKMVPEVSGTCSAEKK